MKFPKYALLAALVYGFSTLPAIAASVVSEVEPNETITQADAQVLPYDDSVTVSNADLASGDVDLFAIDVHGTDKLIFDINTADPANNDTALYVFDPSASLSSPWQTAFGDPNADPATPAVNDPFIGGPDGSGVSLQKTSTDPTQTYRLYVLVTHQDDILDTSGSLAVWPMESNGAGAYDLIITCTASDGSACGSTSTGSGGTGSGGTGSGGTGSGGTGSATTDSGDALININIKPFYMGRWQRINPRSRGLIPVAILSQDGFDPMQIDLTTLRFGSTGDEDSLVRCQPLRRDLNRDGVQDLLCFFSMRKGGFDYTSDNAILKGSLQDGGAAFAAKAPLKVTPYGRRHNYGRSSFGRSHRR